MIFGIESILGMLKRNCSEKILGGMYTKWYGNTWLAIIITLIVNDIFIVIFHYTIPVLTLVSPFVVLIGLYCYLVSRRSVFGVADNSFVYIKLKKVLFKEAEVYEIPIDKIRYLDVKKILFMTFVNLYFISDIGKFKKVKFSYTALSIGFDRKEFKKNYQIVSDKLFGIQKVLDKGDF